jgi:hypothetical protein
VERLNDQEIGCMWAHHYPIRNDNGFSWNICLNIAYIVEARATCARLKLNFPDRLNEILSSLCIPKDEFYQLEKESKAA